MDAVEEGGGAKGERRAGICARPREAGSWWRKPLFSTESSAPRFGVTQKAEMGEREVRETGYTYTYS